MSTVEDVMSRLAAQAAREADEHAKTQALIVEAYLAYRSLRDIALITHLSHEGVRQILIGAGVELRGPGRTPRSGD